MDYGVLRMACVSTSRATKKVWIWGMSRCRCEGYIEVQLSMWSSTLKI